jgi:hypothetical protein
VASGLGPPLDCLLVLLNDQLPELLNGRLGLFVANAKGLGFTLALCGLLKKALGLKNGQ